LWNTNVNIGTSGAEIGGAFGGEKQVADVSQDLMLGKYATSNQYHQLHHKFTLSTRNQI
jgi:hypothetical protein